jgi:hypothetical protein
MSVRWRQTVTAGGVAASLPGLAFLGGVATARIRFDRTRTAVPPEDDEAPQHRLTRLVESQHQADDGQRPDAGVRR